MYQIIFYRNTHGQSEVKQHILNLKNSSTNKFAQSEFKKITNYLTLLSEYGLSLGAPYIKHIDNNLWELRPSRNRILFATYTNNKFIILSIFLKKTEKTPRREIEKAKRNFIDFKRRFDDNE